MSNVPKGTISHANYVPCYFWVVPKADSAYAIYIKVWVPVKVKISPSSIPTNNPRKFKMSANALYKPVVWVAENFLPKKYYLDMGTLWSRLID